MSEVLKRRYTLKLYPNAGQLARFAELLDLHRNLYNAALAERRAAYAFARRYGIPQRITCYGQQAQLKEIRALDPQYRGVSSQALKRTLETIDLAFQAFFRRVKAGEKPGFPKFRGRDFFSGWAYITHGNGWKLTRRDRKNWGLYLTECGVVRARGVVPAGAEPCDLRIVKQDGQWVASVVFNVPAVQKKTGKRRAGLDWGVSTFATVVFDDGELLEVENPRLGKSIERRERELGRSISRKFVARSVDTKRGRRATRPASNREKAEREKLAALKARARRKREDFQHQTSHHILRRVDAIATEKLVVRNMTAEGGAHKRGLNRAILDTAPAAFVQKLKYKAAEREIEFVEVNTREVKPSQTCPACGRVEKKRLSQRVHSCPCGHVEGRDAAAARVMLQQAEVRPGVEGSKSPMKREGGGSRKRKRAASSSQGAR